MKFKKNDIEIEYSESLLDKIREALKREPGSAITEQEIVDFFRLSFTGAIDKGEGIVE